MSTFSEHEQFCAEAEAFAFRFRCGDCFHMSPADGRCIFGYPNVALHDSDSPVLLAKGQWIFCKYFELS